VSGITRSRHTTAQRTVLTTAHERKLYLKYLKETDSRHRCIHTFAFESACILRSHPDKCSTGIEL